MIHDSPQMVYSELSRRVTLEGISLDVQIYRLEHCPNWILEVGNEWGSSAICEEVFATDVDAMAAFQSIVQEEGMATFLSRMDTETLH